MIAFNFGGNWQLKNDPQGDTAACYSGNPPFINGNSIVNICIYKLFERSLKEMIQSNINNRQISADNLNMLRAFSVRYTSAKRWRNFRILISYIFVIIAPFVLYFHPDYKLIFATFGGTWAIISVFLAIREKGIISDAVKVHEEFDVSVFEIKWNHILAGNRITQELVTSWAFEFNSKNEGKIRGWYGNLDGIQKYLDVAICQKANLVWDWRMRRSYFILSCFLVSVILLAGVALSIYSNLSLANYLLLIFIPSSAGFVLSIKELKEHFDNYRAKQKLSEKVRNLIDDQITTNKLLINEVNIRQIQDQIYILRKCPALVPNWFNKIVKNKYELSLQAVIDQYREMLERTKP